MKHKNKIISLRPFCFLTPSVSTISVTILCILLPQILMLFLTRSFNSLLLLCCSITASLATEAVDKLCIRKQHFSVLPVLIQGILIGLFIPADYPYCGNNNCSVFYRFCMVPGGSCAGGANSESQYVPAVNSGRSASCVPL